MDRIEVLQDEIRRLEAIEAGERACEDEAEIVAALERLPAARRELKAATLVRFHRHERLQRERRDAVAHADRVARLRRSIASREADLERLESSELRGQVEQDLEQLRARLAEVVA